ncbi:heavy metal translocating P-type ATPase [Mycobacterium uberis]|uniref:Cation-transporting P-type ATPase B n=1 Tax=Mycobacterium uberis TaxID=2162698 RepID=A0A3E1HE79_9MYCO|nr:cation-translocating P-type ATPase [Mycobacterium uberis]RFD24639.1 heavy metal translocating P-type ATPase [Mycobacterium uberis]
MTAPLVQDTNRVSVQRIQLDVVGMSCTACASRVETKLNKIPGVRASVNFATRVATIDAADVTADELCQVIKQAGYGAAAHAESAAEKTDPDDDYARSLLRRLIVAALLFVPLADLSAMFAIVPTNRFPGWGCLLTALAAPIVTWAAWPFYRVALRNMRHRTASMEVLISVGIVAATGWSLSTIFVARPPRDTHGIWQAILCSDSIYLEVAAGVTVFVLAGRFFEARAKSKAGGALRALAALGAKNVTVLLPNGAELIIPAGELKQQQHFVVRPGEIIAADGVVIDGTAAIDMSAVTGEARPVRASPASTVVGGTTVLDGRLVVEATAVGGDTQFAAIVRLVQDAQARKARVQRLADRIAAVFVPTVFVIAGLAGAVWLVAGTSPDHAFSVMLGVLVIACPCALGLATPTAMMVASGRGAQLGILIKSYQALETIRAIDIVVFDKTGTLTRGQLSVSTVTSTAGWGSGDVLALASAVEAASEHAVATAIVAASADLLPVADFVAFAGCGVSGVVAEHHVEIGKPSWVTRSTPCDVAIDSARREGESRGETVVFVAVDGVVCGAVAISDAVKDSAADAVAALRSRGLRTILLTGDNQAAACAVAAQVGIDTVIADVLPEAKADVIQRLRDQGHTVAMVGDGINDGPALVCADLGLAMGRGTDVAIGAADIILVRDSLDAVPCALDLARATIRVIRTNMIWAFGYNVAAIPIAASGLLNPLIAGAAMAFSSFFVVSNSLRLRNFGPSHPSS